MPTVFPDTEPAWALRAYLVLIGSAYRSETITYGELAGAVNRGGPNLLAEPLNCLARWCTRNDLPQIASLVIDLATAMPALHFTAVEPDAIRPEQEKAWTYDWFSILPPTLAELAQKAN